MHIIGTIIIGGIVGALAKLLMPGKDPGGIIVTILLGIAGGVTARYIGQMAHWYRAGETGPGVIASILGAMLLLFLYRLIIGRRRAV
jgi:uncharacterized membrane protein YeaQ/YmgE (transglycosylase-associated protein family)